MKNDIPFALLTVIGLSGAAFAAEYYVAPALSGGSDLGPGTIAEPWATVAKAASEMVAGDTTFFREGLHQLSSTVRPNSGTADSPITFRAYPGERAVIHGGSGGCFSLQFRSHVVFDGLVMTTDNVRVGASMVYMEHTSHCSFVNCEFYGMPAEVGSENSAVIRCMGTEGGYSVGCSFRNNYFHDNASPALRLYDTDGWIIENNDFANCSQAIGGKDQPINMTVRRNYISGSDLAFYFAGQGGMDNVVITENIVVDSLRGFMIGGLGTNGALRRDVRVHNNTFFNCTAMVHGWDDGNTTDVSFWNNIFFADTSADISSSADVAARIMNMNRWGGTPMDTADYSFTHNCYEIPTTDTSKRFIDAGSAYNSLAAWQTAKPGFEANTLWDDPRFVDAPGGDFHLQDVSPCTGTGQGGQDRGAYPRGNDGTVIGRIPNRPNTRPPAPANLRTK